MDTCARLNVPCRTRLRTLDAPHIFGPQRGGERAASDAGRLLDVPHEHFDWRSLLPRRRRHAQDEGQRAGVGGRDDVRSEEHTSELQSLTNLVCRLLLEKKK